MFKDVLKERKNTNFKSLFQVNFIDLLAKQALILHTFQGFSKNITGPKFTYKFRLTCQKSVKIMLDGATVP